MKSSSPPSWQVDLQCPQCGALVVIEETDRIFLCDYCRVRLYLHQADPCRYYLAPRVEPLEDILFAPYWRFKGMVFTLDRDGVSDQLVDSNRLALPSQPFPISLGVRPQALRLKHLTPYLGGKYLVPERDFSYPGFSRPRAITSGVAGRPSPAGALAARAFIGETLSLIYAPFLVRDGVLMDAILDRPVTRDLDHAGEDLPSTRDAPGRIRFMPMLCPGCGWDLEGEKNALVLLCRNCESAWQAGSGGGMERISFSVAVNGEENSWYLPFWQIRATIPGAGLKSFADLARFANLPRAVRNQWEEQPPVFYIPAFKLQPKLFLRLARALTLTPPALARQGSLPRFNLHHATLPLAEAVEGIRVLLAAVAVKREVLLAGFASLAIELEEPGLVYVPFTLKGLELIQPSLRLSISANAFQWGKLL